MKRSSAAIAGRVLVDTSAYFALIDVSDMNHVRATSAAATTHSRLFATNYVMAETHALLLRRLGRTVAARFITETDQDHTVIVRVSTADERRAREIILTHDDKDYSLTDATSFAVMERLHIGVAFTFDRHFAQYGFAVLGSDEP